MELGSGNARNTRFLLDALWPRHARALCPGRRQRGDAPCDRTGDLRDLSRHLGRRDGRRLRTRSERAPEGRAPFDRAPRKHLGNLQPEQRAALLLALGEELAEDDLLLLGLDLVKDVARLNAAYHDADGVTEAFVRNALTAVNRELDATFEQRRFVFEPSWDPENEWMDIGFRALEAHAVLVRVSSSSSRSRAESASGRRSARSSDGRASSSSSNVPAFASSLGGPMLREISQSWPRARRTLTKRGDACPQNRVCTHLDQIEVTPATRDDRRVRGMPEDRRQLGPPAHVHDCGKIGCCDSSPNRHATAHAGESGHPIIRSAEPGEDWSWCYVDEVAFAAAPR